MTITRFTVPPGDRFRLAEFDPGFTGAYEDKKDTKKDVKRNLERLHELQERLYADRSHALVIVLQAMDTAGKDGTIEHTMGSFNPQGVVVTPFKVPTEDELAHDFLWRAHKATPARGMVGIFNRSHYEDVLVVRVKSLVDEEVWRGRYEHINNFERLLASSGVKIVKLFLNISPQEQAERLLARQQTAEKQWKFSPGDLEDRKLWPQFMAAYEDALTLCNTEVAPWHVIPSNHKWYRNLAVSEVLIDALESLDLRYPEPVDDIESYRIPDVI